MLKSHSGYFLPLLYSDASYTFAKEMAILKFPNIFMSVAMSMRLPLVRYRVSIKSFPDYKHLLQENFVEYEHFFKM